MLMNSRWRASRPSVSASSSTNPLIEVSGLRSSCEAVATNSLFRCSSRARSDTSRTVQTCPRRARARAAVTASVRPSRFGRRPRRRARRQRDGQDAARLPVGCPATQLAGRARAARGLARGARCPSASRMTSASPRLRTVTSSRRRSASTRAAAAWTSSAMRLNDRARIRSSSGPSSVDAGVAVAAGESRAGVDEVVERAPHRGRRARRPAPARRGRPARRRPRSR